MRSFARCVFALSFLTACVIATDQGDDEEKWTYQDQSAWDSLNGSFCQGARQSPIDIPTSAVVDGGAIGLRRLVMTDWDVATRGEFANDGHTLKYTLGLEGDHPHEDDDDDTEEDLARPGTETHLGPYNLVQFHFHWGPDGDKGAEHLLDGFRYSGELHFVHASASQQPNEDGGDEYTVVGVFLAANPALAYNDTVWEKLASSIPPYNQTRAVEGIVLNDMLPNDGLGYYYYEGSLTTPPCDEIVQWVLLRNPVEVPEEFFARLRQTARNQDGTELLQENYRLIQPLNDRQVYQHVEGDETEEAPTSDDAATSSAMLSLLFLAILAGAALV